MSENDRLRVSALTAVREWYDTLSKQSNINAGYIFGSLLKDDRFVPGRSDVDLLLVFSQSIHTPVQRADTLHTLLDRKISLETLLKSILRSTGREPIASIVLVTPFELAHGVHKGRDHRFYTTTEFVTLDKEFKATKIDSGGAELFRNRYPSLVQAIQRTQDIRNKYLAVNASGNRSTESFVPYSDARETLPKDMCRHAAPLRYFDESLTDHSEFDVVSGLSHILTLVTRLQGSGSVYRDLRESLLRRSGAHAPKPSLSVDQQLLLWEIIGCEAERLIRHAEQERLLTISIPPSAETERAFLEATSEPSLQIGGISIESKLLPEFLWQAPRREHLYLDDPESERRIELRMSQLSLPVDTLDVLVNEMAQALHLTEQASSSGRTQNEKVEDEKLREIYESLIGEGSNAYPRVVALPRIESVVDTDGASRSLVIDIAASRYGIALLEERKVSLPTASRIRSEHVLNSLAVRVAYVYERNNSRWLEFHQRSISNATYKGAWDVGAAGYIDLSRHRDPLDLRKSSLWQAASSEISEELAISSYALPYRDNYFFFGIGRDDPTGQLSVLGYVAGITEPNDRRPPTARVQRYDRCQLEPEALASFFSEKQKWVPTAVLTTILTLQAFGYSIDQLDRSFRDSLQHCSFQA